MKSVDYDFCYATLGLTPGASLEQIQLAWRLKAAAMHPDNFASGPMKDEATRMLAQINGARDVLRAWWQQHQAAPPTNEKAHATASGARGMSPPPPVSPSPSAFSDATGKTALVLPEPNIIASRWTSEPIGPPPFRKGAKHRLYDWFMRSESYEAAAVFWPTFLFASLVPPYLIEHLLSRVYGIPITAWTDSSVYGYVNLAFWLASTAVLFFTLCYDFDLYKHLETPYIDYVAGNTEAVLAKVNESLKGLSGWQVGSPKFEPQSDIAEQSAELVFGNSSAATVNIRLAPSTESGYSFVCYWFTASATVVDFVAVSKAVREADALLRARLKG